MMVIDNKFNIGDLVYLKTDINQSERIVRAFYVMETGIEYGLGCGADESWHFDFEITEQVDVLKTSKN